MKGNLQIMRTLANYPGELLLLIAKNLGPADIACFYLTNKHIHSFLHHFNFRNELIESRDSKHVISTRKERLSLMIRLRESIPKDWEYCAGCCKYKRYDEDWLQERVDNPGDNNLSIISFCSTHCAQVLRSNHTRAYAIVGAYYRPGRRNVRHRQ